MTATAADVAHCHDLHFGNPLQRRQMFGADLLSRSHAAPSALHLRRMRSGLSSWPLSNPKPEW